MALQHQDRGDATSLKKKFIFLWSIRIFFYFFLKITISVGKNSISKCRPSRPPFFFLPRRPFNPLNWCSLVRKNRYRSSSAGPDSKIFFFWATRFFFFFFFFPFFYFDDPGFFISAKELNFKYSTSQINPPVEREPKGKSNLESQKKILTAKEKIFQAKKNSRISEKKISRSEENIFEATKNILTAEEEISEDRNKLSKPRETFPNPEKKFLKQKKIWI